MSVQRVNFPGFTKTGDADSSTHEIEIGTIIEGGHTFVLDMLRNKDFPDLNFMIAKISKSTGEKLWSFQGFGFIGYGILAKAGEETVVALVGKGKEGKVELVVPLADLASGKKSDLRRMATLKVGAAAFLKRKVALSRLEEVVRKADVERAIKEAEARRIAEVEARETARRDQVAKIMARSQIMGFAMDNRQRRGIPVVESEWQSLPDGTFVVLVKQIGEDGKIGGLIEAFQVVKERGKNPKKGFPAQVSALPPAVAEESKKAVQPNRSVVIERGEEALEVFLYASIADIRAAREQGLNGGALAGVEVKGGKVEVYEIHKEKMNTLGHFVPLG